MNQQVSKKSADPLSQISEWNFREMRNKRTNFLSAINTSTPGEFHSVQRTLFSLTLVPGKKIGKMYWNHEKVGLWRYVENCMSNWGELQVPSNVQTWQWNHWQGSSICRENGIHIRAPRHVYSCSSPSASKDQYLLLLVWVEDIISPSMNAVDVQNIRAVSF